MQCSLRGQSTFNINKYYIEFNGPSTRQFTYFPAIISNISNTKQTFVWKRTYINPQTEWKLFTWDSGNRYDDTTNSREFSLEPNDVNTFVCEVQPDSIEGTATIYYKFCNKSDTNDCATLVFLFKTNMFTSIENEKENISITDWQLFDIYGKLVKEFYFYPSIIELENYSNGVYFLVNYKNNKLIKIIN